MIAICIYYSVLVFENESSLLIRYTKLTMNYFHGQHRFENPSSVVVFSWRTLTFVTKFSSFLLMLID